MEASQKLYKKFRFYRYFAPKKADFIYTKNVNRIKIKRAITNIDWQRKIYLKAEKYFWLLILY